MYSGAFGWIGGFSLCRWFSPYEVRNRLEGESRVVKLYTYSGLVFVCMAEDEKFTYSIQVHGPSTLRARVYEVRSQKDTMSIVRECKAKFADQFNFNYSDLRGHTGYHDKEDELAYVFVTSLNVEYGEEDE